MNSCDGLDERMEFAGDYSEHSCSVRVQGARESLDSGLWTCHLESYTFGGGRGSGTVRSKDIYVQVMPPTTTTTTTTTEEATMANFNLSRLDVELDDKPLPTKHDVFQVSLAKFLPYSVTILVVVIFLVLFTVVVVLHKLKASRQQQTSELVSIQPKLEIPKTTDQNDLLFLKTAFPHVMRFPSDDLGLNL